MKKLLMLGVFVASLGLTAAAADSPIKLSLYDNIAWPKTNDTNVVLGLVDSNTPTIKGVALTIGSTRVDDMTGLSWAWIYTRTNNLTGVQLGFVNYTKRINKGLQIGLVNIIEQNGWLPIMVIVNGKFNQNQKRPVLNRSFLFVKMLRE